MKVRTPVRFAIFSVTLALAGCVTKPSATTDVLSETAEERSTRRIFKDDWLRPSVSQEDYDFFYKGFFWGGK